MFSSFAVLDIAVFFIFCVLFLCGCGNHETQSSGNHVRLCMASRISTLDPVLAADTSSQGVICAFYDTLLQYKYISGKYLLEPSMLAEMPEISPDSMEIRCRLREDLYFQDSPVYAGLDKEARHIYAKDVVYSLLRLADARIQSPGYWVLRGKIQGIEDFYRRTQKAAPDDDSVYDAGCSGLTAEDEYHIRIRLSSPNPRFLYSLALPYCAVVSRLAVEKLGEAFRDTPCGSGPFRLENWEKDYKMVMTRNPDFRREMFDDADDPKKKTVPLPYSDIITVFFVKQAMSQWLLFLQGELDFYALDGENFESVVADNLSLSPALVKRGISMVCAPELQTNYIGFNFADPVLQNNPDLRRAISLAFDKDMRVIQSGGRFFKAYGPVPPGIHGFAEGETGPFGCRNIPLAKEYMKKAGYPDGIDPATGKHLELTFDQAGSGTSYAQTAELMARDMKEIGIVIKAEFNTRPRFLQKVSGGNTQLFRFSWTGDYPDAENFLQLFYGPNAGSCNRVMYRNPTFDAMFEEIIPMPDTPERTAKYEKISRFLQEECPWIFETHTMSFVLKHSWLQNYRPHDFSFNKWKYYAVDADARSAARKNFQPLDLSDLRGSGE